ncbi:MAG: LysM peptidoglycan-binding domain-containing protein [Gammaproteobacteria bacterium]|nr:LysM peptidoglycan-binding domain-containing protein [Gammaproteobacteria bacterium]
MRCSSLVLLTVFAAVGVTLVAEPVKAAQTTVQALHVQTVAGQSRIIFDVSEPLAAHQIFTLGNPDRLVIDMRDARLAPTVASAASHPPLIKSVRFGLRNTTDLRMVLDVVEPVRAKSFMLGPDERHGHRLVVYLHGRSTPRQKSNPTPGSPAAGDVTLGARSIVIAIDAGHGGADPGAIGAGGTYEKDITLSIAKRLAGEINAMRGFRGVLIRKGDEYLRLRTRIARARRSKADLLVSIHADAFKDRRVRGSSVWVLSSEGASSEARWLVAQENAADLVGGVSLDDKDELLKQVILDLSQTATLNDSVEVANVTLNELRKLGRVHKRTVQRAGFMVLKAPDIPSILVEAAFISNPAEERRLRDAKHQRRLAQSIARGIRGYFERKPPPGTALAVRSRHVISPGETLSAIATRYDISVRALRESNNLASDRLRVGQVLRIPGQGS